MKIKKIYEKNEQILFHSFSFLDIFFLSANINEHFNQTLIRFQQLKFIFSSISINKSINSNLFRISISLSLSLTLYVHICYIYISLSFFICFFLSHMYICIFCCCFSLHCDKVKRLISVWKCGIYSHKFSFMRSRSYLTKPTSFACCF